MCACVHLDIGNAHILEGVLCKVSGVHSEVLLTFKVSFPVCKTGCSTVVILCSDHRCVDHPKAVGSSNAWILKFKLPKSPKAPSGFRALAERNALETCTLNPGKPVLLEVGGRSMEKVRCL